jgi:hypothetical protein
MKTDFTILSGCLGLLALWLAVVSFVLIFIR